MRKYFFFLKKYYKKLILLSIVVLISSIINIMLTFLSGAYLDVLVENATLQKLYLLCLLFLGASCGSCSCKDRTMSFSLINMHSSFLSIYYLMSIRNFFRISTHLKIFY